MDDYSTNPFSDNYIEDIEDNVENEVETKETGAFEKPPIHPNTVTVDVIAEYLINKQYTLTALEFHTEILENGKELPRLRNYFSNPANFEQQATFRDSLHPGTLYRAGSCSTFDSLDLTRYSDDGNQQVDDRVAVLEFELRKAKETIKSLRENLTDAVENDTFLKSPTNPHGTTELSTNKDHQVLHDTVTQVELKPLEKRAINYLINEYLLHNEYKLTSITLAEENADQDFEDWDDVGLNMPKPANLISLFRDSAMSSTVNACYVTTSDYDKEVLADSEQSELLESLKCECSRLKKENTELTDKIIQLEMKENAFSSSTPRRTSFSNDVTDEIASPCNGVLEEHYHTPMKSDDSDPEIFLTPASQLPEKVRKKSEDKVVRIEKGENLSSTISSVHNGIGAEDTVDNHPCISYVKTDPVVRDKPPHSRMSNSLWNALLSYTQTELDKNWLVVEVSKVASTCEELVFTLARCLPKIVPTVLLQKRDQLIPLLLGTAAMHPSADERNQILHDLFNLIKKPNACERQMILCGCIAYAKHVGPTRTEEELLPQCWEQIGHKYPERRQLVCEACGAIAPYLRAEIRSSLLLSILQQLLQEERLDEVRQAVVKSLSIIFAFLDDDDKYNLAFDMLTRFLSDSSLVVMQTSKECLLPSFAAWACNNGKIHDHLVDFALSSVEKIAEQKDANPSSFLGCMETLHRVMPHLFTYVLLKTPCQTSESKEAEDEVIVSGNRHPVQCDTLCDPTIMFGDVEKYTKLLSCFDENVKNENFNDWDLMHWCLHELIPRLLRIVRLIDPNDQDCVSSLCHFFNDLCSYFGKIFVNTQLKKQFKTIFSISGKDADRQIYAGETPLTTAALSVYACGVLTVYTEKESKGELLQFLKDMLLTLSSCHASLDSMISCFLQIRNKDPSYHELLLNVLWYGVTHTSVYVRMSTASLFVVVTTEDVDSRIISTKVVPALITLSTDMNSAVRTATIPALGAVVECSHISPGLIDHVIEQMATFLAPSYYDETQDSNEEPKQPHHDITMQLVRTMGHVCPKAHPKFRDEFVLPHLAAIAAGNNQVTNRTKRSDIALELLDAYSSISCCFISDNLLLSAFLPGVRCLLQDIEKLHPEHVDTVHKFIKEKETKLERGSINSFESACSPCEKTNKYETKPRFSSNFFKR